MPLNPLIALQGQPVQIGTPNPLEAYATLAQIQNARSQGSLRDLQAQQLLLQQQQAQAYGQHIAGGGNYVTTPAQPAQPPSLPPLTEGQGFTSAGPVPQQAPSPTTMDAQGQPLGLPQPAAQQPATQRPKTFEERRNDIYRLAPLLAKDLTKELFETERMSRETEKFAAEALSHRASATKLGLEARKTAVELYSGILKGMVDNPGVFEQGIAAMRALDVPEALIAQLGPTYDVERIKKLQLQGASEKDRLEAESRAAELAQKGQKVIPVDTGTETKVIREIGGQVVPTSTTGEALGSAKGAAPEIAVRTKMGEEAVAMGQATQQTYAALDRMERLVEQGVYTASPELPTVLAAYRRGIVTPLYDKDKLARTDQLMKEGTGLPFSVLGGNTSFAKTSDKEQDIIQRATGNFANLQSPEALKLSLKELRETTDTKARLANEALEKIKSGTPLGGYGQPTPSKPSAPSPSQGSGALVLTDADITTTLADPKNKGRTREQVIAAAKLKGWRYP